MIDFSLLDKLIASARDPHKGKPLDTVRGLHSRLQRGSLMRIFTKGAFINRAPWLIRSNAQNNVPCKSGELAEFLASGMRNYKDALYSHHGVYETYDFSFIGYFKETNHGQSLALAA